uniref:HAT C-terminal dimerisation domain-containing protein n=1 Tax=Oryzias latipes TaxID=8090 RepID=A0A3P9H253_ORYLA
MEAWLKRSSHGAESTDGQVKNKTKQEATKSRKYMEEYVSMGFTSTSSDPPQVFLCGEKLANASMKPAHLQRHQSSSGENFLISRHPKPQCQKSPLHHPKLVAKAKKPFTIAEDLLLPAAVVLAETMLDKKSADTFKTVPLSKETVCRTIDTMGTDIMEQVVGKLGDSFSSCSSVCTDAAASMKGSAKGLIARIKKENPDIKWAHCVIRRGALALCENMGAEHTELLLHTEVRWLSRGRVLSRLFESRAEVHTFLTEHGSPHATMFENTDWLAKLCYLADIFRKLNELNMSLQGKDTSILNLYDKVGGFLKKAEMWKRACDQEDFTCFPQLDVFLSNEDVGTAPVKLVIVGHLANLISGFHSYFPDMDEKSVQLDWVRNPFLLSEANRSKLPLTHQEKLMEVASDRGLQMKFGASTLTQFWLCVRQEHPELGQKALEQLLPFASTYLCEASFSAMMLIKTKQRNRLCLEKSLITAVASLPPRMTKILSEVQAYISH